MSQIPIQISTKDELTLWLNQFQHSSLPAQWAQAFSLYWLETERQWCIELPFASHCFAEDFNAWVEAQKRQGLINDDFAYQLTLKVKARQTQVKAKPGIKNIIAISSGKGGVGKSTVAVNLALAMAQAGASVGVLDADIYGPSLPIMLGLKDTDVEIIDEKWMAPQTACGISTQSIGYLVKDDAAIWRGPMASRALMQLLEETLWPELDYLIVDMPPGTGDIQLTLAQQMPVTAAVIVTTPQDLALTDVYKGVQTFEKVSLPVIGVIENMSFYLCPHCGESSALFGGGGAERLSQKTGLTVFGRIALDASICEDADKGQPSVYANPSSALSLVYKDIADNLCQRLFWHLKPTAEKIAIKSVD